VVDKKGNLIVGEVSDDGTEAYPFLLESDSVVGTPIYATDNTVQGMKLTFDFSQDQDDACIRMIQSSDLAGVDLLLLEGLRDVFNAQSILSVTGFVIQFYTKGIEAGKKIPVEGLVITDFISTVGGATSKVRQTNNTPADIAITSVTEGTGANAGKYTIVLPTQTTGDSIDVLVTKAGFSFTAETVVIP
jgi:hypothetical protein